jgi:hypothetical protein
MNKVPGLEVRMVGGNEMKHRWAGSSRTSFWILAVVLFAACVANATTFSKQANLVDLIGESELIIHGTVKDVTDGIDERGIPYTEVTIRVLEALKGDVSGDYTFRQFGLLKPRSLGNGKVNLMVTPSEFATYSKGEETILFLYKQARQTGLRTTTGLSHGKFKVSLGGATSQANNAGLFDGIDMDLTTLTDTQKRVFATKSGAVNAQAFVSLVKQAVSEKWVETGRMKNAQK